MGVMWGQKEYLAMYTIYYINKKMEKHEHNYTMTEKEFLVVLYEINKLVCTY